MDVDAFEALAERVEGLLSRLRTLKQENQTLKAAIQEKEALMNQLAAEKEAAGALNETQIHRIADDAKADPALLAIFFNGYALEKNKK